MLMMLRTSIFDSPAQTLVNTVNTEGVMGKGIAKQFKEQFPEMFLEYKRLCVKGALKIGHLHLWRGLDSWVLNFPTKTSWRLPSRVEYIERGLEKFVSCYQRLQITSVSFPPLGCGNGNLDWDVVRPLMISYLKNLPIQMFIHDKQVDNEFVPEHRTAIAETVPSSFSEFYRDIKSVIFASRGEFETIDTSTPFSVSHNDGALDVDVRGKKISFQEEDLKDIWATLSSGLLTADTFSSESMKKNKSYLFGVIRALPYVRRAEVQHIRDHNTMRGHALFFEKSRRAKELLLGMEAVQPNKTDASQ